MDFDDFRRDIEEAEEQARRAEEEDMQYRLMNPDDPWYMGDKESNQRASVPDYGNAGTGCVLVLVVAFLIYWIFF